MNIEFRQVVPAFLAGTTNLQSDVWGSDFLLHPGERVLVRAQSGKGKTTFVSYLFRLRGGYKGTILVDGKDLSSYTLEETALLRQQTISLVFQELRLLEDFTVKENLELKMKLTGGASPEEAQAMLRELGVEEFWNRPCRLLSFGQRQRVSIVRSLLQPFNWLVLDEPFSHLDEANIAKAMGLINRACEARNAGFILTSLGGDYNGNYNRIFNL
ncbi:MAG: ATP-binding cassette domain-containing protein [Chitinophagales bacterium]